MSTRRDDLQTKINGLRMDLALLHKQLETPTSGNTVQPKQSTKNIFVGSSQRDLNETQGDDDILMTGTIEMKLAHALQKLAQLRQKRGELQSQLQEVRSENSQLQKQTQIYTRRIENYHKLEEDYIALQKSCEVSEKFRKDQKAMISLLQSTITDNKKTRNNSGTNNKTADDEQKQQQQQQQMLAQQISERNKSSLSNVTSQTLFETIPSPLNSKARSSSNLDSSSKPSHSNITEKEKSSRLTITKSMDNNENLENGSPKRSHSPISSSRLKSSSQPRQSAHEGGSKSVRQHTNITKFRAMNLQSHPYYRKNSSSQPHNNPKDTNSQQGESSASSSEHSSSSSEAEGRLKKVNSKSRTRISPAYSRSASPGMRSTRLNNASDGKNEHVAQGTNGAPPPNPATKKREKKNQIPNLS